MGSGQYAAGAQGVNAGGIGLAVSGNWLVERRYNPDRPRGFALFTLCLGSPVSSF